VPGNIESRQNALPVTLPMYDACKYISWVTFALHDKGILCDQHVPRCLHITTLETHSDTVVEQVI